MQFLYYRPGHTRSVSFDDVTRWGLGYAFDKQPFSGACQQKTPDGNNGQVFIAAKRDKEIPNMNLDKQTWREMPGDREGAPVYVGMWNDHQPTPSELEKPDGLPGYAYTLLDGHEWSIPLVRRYGDDGHYGTLPRLLDFDDAGNAIDGEVIEKYRHLWELTGPIVDDLLATYDIGPDQETPLTKQQAANTAVNLLATNYRVSIAEVALLGLIPNDATVSGLCALACDWPELLSRLPDDSEAKKNGLADDGASISSGDAA